MILLLLVTAFAMETLETVDLEDEPVDSFEVDVSFTFNADNSLHMKIHAGNESFSCPHLEPEHLATEIRADNGSFILFRHDGILLTSSSEEVECRVSLQNKAGTAYTRDDVHERPNMAATIVFSNTSSMNIETQGEGFIAKVPSTASSTTTDGRRLQTYEVFDRCYQKKKRWLKMGVILDETFLRVQAKGSKEQAALLLKRMWMDVSIPYEKQLNIGLYPATILFHDDSSLRKYKKKFRCTKGDKYFDFYPGKEAAEKFRNYRSKGEDNAGWMVVSGCTGGGVVGVANIGVMGRERNAVGTAKFKLWVIAHEIGHMMGAQHSFKKGLKKSSYKGLMDYDADGRLGKNGLVQFHPVHEKAICKIVKKLRKKKSSGMVSFDERWGTSPPPSLPPVDSHTENPIVTPTPGGVDNWTPTPGGGDNWVPTPVGGDNWVPTPGGVDNWVPTPGGVDNWEDDALFVLIILILFLMFGLLLLLLIRRNMMKKARAIAKARRKKTELPSANNKPRRAVRMHRGIE